MANYWLHNGFLDMSGEKMSKSLGNVVLVHDLLKAWPGEVLRRITSYNVCYTKLLRG